MSYGLLNKDALIELLNQKDEELKKKEAELAQKVQPVIQIQPSVPHPDPWNLKCHDMSESFEDFILSWEVYQTAAQLNSLPDITKVAIFWSALGSPGMLKCQKDWKFSEADKASVTIIIQKIRDKLKNQRLPLIDRIKFTECTRKSDENEPITDFLKRVENLAEYCNYGAQKDEMLLQQTLKGMQDPVFQKELLSIENLTWNLTKQKINAKKACDSQLEVLSTVKSEPKDVKKISKKSKLKCRFCDTEHNYGSKYCPAYGKFCNFCGIKNHTEKACRKKKANESSDESESESNQSRKSRKPKNAENTKYTDKKKSRKVKKIIKSSESSETEEDSSYWEQEVREIRQITSNKCSQSGAFVHLKLKIANKWQPVECQLDTGSASNLIGESNLKRIIPNPKILNSEIRLRDIQKHKIETLGETTIQCIRDEKKYNLIFQVVKFDQDPILSENSCRILKLIEYSNENDKATFIHNAEINADTKKRLRNVRRDIRQAKEARRELDNILADLQSQQKHLKATQ